MSIEEDAVFSQATMGQGISAGHDGNMRLWDPASSASEPSATMQAHNAPVRALLHHEGAVW